jgi:hypothetical protein
MSLRTRDPLRDGLVPRIAAVVSNGTKASSGRCLGHDERACEVGAKFLDGGSARC